MPNPIALSKTEDFRISEGLTALDAAVTLGPDPLTHCQEVGLYVVFSADAMGGTVVVETAHAIGYAGAWSEVAEVAWRGPARAHYVSLPGLYLAVRCRVTQPIVNGSVDIYAIGG